MALDSNTVLRRLKAATTDKLLTQNEIRDRKILFTGYVLSDRFRVSLKITKPNNFLPLVKGTIESSSSGSIVFMTYSLFPSTKVFMIFWLLFSLVAGLLVTHQQSLYLVTIPIVIITLILWVAWANFRIQVRLTREAFRQIFAVDGQTF